MALDPTWEAKAGAWARFARSPEHDHFFWLFNGPRFLELIPEPGRCTLDLACDEGRLGRLLGQRGHRVVAVDGAPTMGRLAHEAGGQLVVVGDAGRLPIASGIVDLAVVFMSLQDISDLEPAIAEVARVLVEGGQPSGRSASTVKSPSARVVCSRSGHIPSRPRGTCIRATVAASRSICSSRFPPHSAPRPLPYHPLGTRRHAA